MIEILQPGFRTGAVHIPASKSQAHRLLICAALSQNETVIRCRGISRDIAATADCLNALGAEIWLRGEDLTVRPITQKPQGTRHLHCQESGSTLRFLLPLPAFWKQTPCSTWKGGCRSTPCIRWIRS